MQLGSVAGPVIQANGRLTFEDDLRSGGLLYFTTQWTSVCTELAESMVTLGGVKRWQLWMRDTSRNVNWPLWPVNATLNIFLPSCEVLSMLQIVYQCTCIGDTYINSLSAYLILIATLSTYKCWIRFFVIDRSSIEYV